MKITMISEAYPPMSGGVATSAQRLARQFCKAGHDVVVLTFDNIRPLTEDDFYYDEFDNGVHIYRVGPFFLKNATMKQLPAELNEKYFASLRRRAYNQMSKIIKGENADIILSFYLLNSGWIAQMLSNEFDIPCVAGVRGNDIGRNIFHTSRFAVTKWVLDEADAVVCVNEHLRKRATVAFKEIRNKTISIANGFDCNRKDINDRQDKSVIKEWGWSERDLILTFIGTLREKKGVAILLKALQAVNRNEPHVRLLVVGPEIQGAEKLISGTVWKQLIDDSIIHVTGQLPRDQVFFHASIADAVCIPSLDDGMANGLLEGMAIGLCPITTTVLSDVVNNDINGIVVEPGSVDELVCAFDKLYSNRELIVIYGKKSAELIRERFTPEREAKQYLELFEKVLERRK